MSEEDFREQKRRLCACGCKLDVEAHRPKAEYRVNHRQRGHRRRTQDVRDRFWGRFGDIRRSRPAVRSAS